MGAVDLPALIHGEATCELSWRRWLAETRCHELSVQDWLPARARLVIVAPHPDDEILACGGLIATHVTQGGRVLIVAVTDGEASHNDSPSFNREDLAYIRRHERWLGLRHLGLSQPMVLALALEDGNVQQQGSVLLQRLMSLLQPDDVVVSTWENDGHPDHDTTGQMTRRASAAIGCACLAAPVWMWHWATPGDARVPWPRLRGLPLSAAAGLHKQAALAAHRSQLNPRSADLGAVLGPAIVQRAAWRTEYYFI
ncbi:PIG-L deacetylase family protein [Hydrogenophaga sp.]|uniref:PIG-L deacetylase family protein n=1 Tax=Hydrogenophaga sp. TaxID=1904254 RepID=UPI0027314C95|nr:PIG-L family deacetylase [Hydrogenophaga sp.]MDP2019094.1 PIG-L family deacetylase [Hydrogenophaga sp.]MDP3167859.1 PIG-L family deacetylase [Hydrogenophaga sp.]MDP3811558.1 PIG-L family deacetylase [Hydrogenophaga sp.]